MQLRIGSIELNAEEPRGVLEWGLENEATYYDSTYVASCKKIGSILLTADDFLYEKAQEEVVTLHLKDYRSE